MIVVVGASGALGGAICQALADQGQAVRALVRPSTGAERLGLLSSRGTQLVHGDLRSAEDLRKLCAGARAVITTASAMNSRQSGDTIRNVDEVGQLGLVEAAERAGVDQFVHVSVPTQVVASPLEDAKRRVEERLRASSLDYTVLRPAYFTEIWLSQKHWPLNGFDFVRRRARLAGDGERAVRWISLADVARYATSALGNAACRKRCFDLAGPDALSPLQVVELLERAGGQKFGVELVAEDKLRARHTNGDAFEQSFTALLLSCGLGPESDGQSAQRAMPFELGTVNSYITRIMKHL